tara:strand:+ start:232 stop:381 length:150 start_codon:yes stop_codon:yes gene_type:complete
MENRQTRDNDAEAQERIYSGFDDFADGNRASISPRRKRLDFRGLRDQKF